MNKRLWLNSCTRFGVAVSHFKPAYSVWSLYFLRHKNNVCVRACVCEHVYVSHVCCCDPPAAPAVCGIKDDVNEKSRTTRAACVRARLNKGFYLLAKYNWKWPWRPWKRNKENKICGPSQRGPCDDERTRDMRVHYFHPVRKNKKITQRKGGAEMLHRYASGVWKKTTQPSPCRGDACWELMSTEVDIQVVAQSVWECR